MSEETKRPGQIILSWWRDNLRPESENGIVRAFRARLRRADRPLDVMIEQESVKLYEELRTAPGKHSRDPLALAALLPVLAHVKAHSHERIARVFGAKDPEPISKLRFQRMMRLDDIHELASALRRSLPLIDSTCNVAALGDDFLRWNSADEDVRERVRNRWCFDYFGKTWPTAPQNTHDLEGLA